MSPTPSDKAKTSKDRAASRNPHSSFTRDVLLGLRAWARQTFSLASVLSGLKSLLWVAPLSVVIWVYAEQEDIALPQPFTISISLRSSDPTRVVRLVDPANGKITVDLAGANANMQHIREQLALAPTLQIDVPQSSLSSTGNHQMSGALINDLDVFRNNGITVSNVIPPDLTVNVDALDDVEVEVQAAPDGKNFSAAPSFTPRKVHIRAPRSVIANAKASNKLVAYAQINEASEPLTPGAHDLPRVPLTVPFTDSLLTISPTTVSAHVEIKKSDATLVLEAIPIWAIVPPVVDDKYKAVYDPPSLTNVVVSGPEDQINALQTKTYPLTPKATFEVNPNLSMVGVDQTARLHFDLPPDVHVSPDFAQRTITYKLVERRAAE